MSDARIPAAEFSELWKNVSKRPARKTAPPPGKGFQSPQRSRYSGFNHGDSPGDVEVSQDIFWDPISPPQAKTGLRNTKIVEISDIVNRIAPKDGKPVGAKSPLLQWIGDGAIPCTPEIPKQRVKKKSIRHSGVDLMKLAKQFDENMQQDWDTSEHPTVVNGDIHESASTSEANPSDASHQSNVKDLKCSLTSDQVEAELQALFDCSTQKVSGGLSQGSSASACSQNTERQPVTLAELQQSELKSTNKSGSAVIHPDKDPHGFSAPNCLDFDDNWEDDDLINAPLVSVISHNSDEQHGTNRKIALKCDTKSSTAANLNSTNQVSKLYPKSDFSLLQELCPNPKTSNRRTFKLEPNPSFQSKSASIKELTSSSFTLLKPSKSLLSTNKPATTKPQPEKITNSEGGKGICEPEDSVKGISDSFWENGDDDELLYEMCDSMETMSNSQPHHNNCHERQASAVEGQQQTTATLQMELDWSTNTGSSANRQSACMFVRSKSIPGMSSEAVNYQGWNFPMQGANSKSRMSHSLPGRRVSQLGDSSASFQDVSSPVDLKSHPMRAGSPQNHYHTSFKRSISDSAVVGNKVFVTNQMRAKYSAAEIERKKREALARRRLRMQNTPKS